MIAGVLIFLVAMQLAGFAAFVIFTIVDAAYFSRPLWRVYYPPEQKGRVDFKGGYSDRMSFWVARDYASIFNSEVVKHTDLEGRPADPNYVPMKAPWVEDNQ